MASLESIFEFFQQLMVTNIPIIEELFLEIPEFTITVSNHPEESLRS
jgi:hypothetical protein